MNCWLIFFLLICGGNNGRNCGNRMTCNCGCIGKGYGNECREERREECCETRRDDCCEVRRDDCCEVCRDDCFGERWEERREERRDNRRDCDRCDSDNHSGMNTPPWARGKERDWDDSCGCQNR